VRSVVRSLLGSRPLLRAVTAYGLFILVEYSVWLAMLVYAYEQNGATAAGLVAFAQLVPAALMAPFAAVAADRSPPVRLFVLGCGAQAAGMALAAYGILSGGPSAVAYLGAIIAATAVCAIRPAQAAMLPTLARTPDELTAANVALAVAEAFGAAGAGFVTAALLVRGPGQVFAAGVVLVTASAWVVAPLPSVAMGATAEIDAGEGGEGQGEGEDEETVSLSPLADVRDGIAALAGARGAGVLVTMLATQELVLGALDVLFVVLAFSVLDANQSWVGYLNSAFAIGGLLVGAIGVLLIGRRLPVPILAAALVVGGSLALISVANNALGVVVLLVVMGASRQIFDLACRTLLQRSVPAEVVGRVFGLVEGLAMAAMALGSVAVSALVALGGADAALIGIGAVLPVVVVANSRTLLSLDRETRVPIVEIGLLRSIDLFALLPPPAVESLARALEPRRLVAGETLIKQGEPGDNYYAVADGTLGVWRDGVEVRTCSRGSGVGEIALLRSVPRTATVRARTDALVYVLDRASFLVAMTGHAPTKVAVADRVDHMLRADPPPAVSG
jgi:MFS family permease